MTQNLLKYKSRLTAVVKVFLTRSSKGVLPEDFDTDAYIELNADVKDAGADPINHYITSGQKEGRCYRFNAELPHDFCAEEYLGLNPDLKETHLSLHHHYRVFGATENRRYRYATDLPVDFDEHVYLELNPELRGIGIDPSIHYVGHGFVEGRRYKYDRGDQSFVPDPNNRAYIKSYTTDYRHDPFNVNPKVIAFYLPQYHRVKENDEWWGEGFTEWTNVRKAKPNFVGHAQPHVPVDGYYDLTDPTVQRRQSQLAVEYGLSAFCYYMYWFDGRRILEKPLDQMLDDPSIAMPFCLCWANENWTRAWDGKSHDVLIEQINSPDSDKKFIEDAMKYLRDPRYLRVDGALMLLVYRVDLLPNCRQTAATWRDEVRKAGLGELHLCAVQFYGVTDPEPWGFDAAVEFPPHGWLVPENLHTPVNVLNKGFTGEIFDYDKSVDYALRKQIPDYRWYRGLFPGWDNTARRQDTPHIFHNANPHAFERWFTEILRQTVIMAPQQHQIVFINAWNEWGEGAHLEPDELNGRYNLMALHSSLKTIRNEAEPLAILSRLRRYEDYADRYRDELSLLNLLRGYHQSSKVLSAMLRAKGLSE